MRGSRRGVRPPPEKSRKYRVSLQYYSANPRKKSQSYLASIQCWAIIDPHGPFIAVFGSSIRSLTKKKKLSNLDPLWKNFLDPRMKWKYKQHTFASTLSWMSEKWNHLYQSVQSTGYCKLEVLSNLRYHRVFTGLKGTWIYRTVLKNPWKLTLPWKVLEKQSKALKSPWILPFTGGFFET